MNTKILALGGFAAAVLGVTTAVMGTNLVTTTQRAAAQACSPLNVVGATGGETRVEKKVSPPATGVTESNWNTDFAIGNDPPYSYYLAVVTPSNDGNYAIQLNLKYPDETADRIFDESAYTLTQGQPLQIEARPRPGVNPYQVNLQVGGVTALGNTYSVAAYGCR